MEVDTKCGPTAVVVVACAEVVFCIDLTRFLHGPKTKCDILE